MRLIVVVISFFISSSVIAETKPSVMHRFYGGLGKLNIYNNVKLAQLGYHKSFGKRNPLILGIENSIYYNNKKYDWPDVGSYRYQRLIDIATFSVGIQISKKRKFTPFVGLCYNYTLYQGKLVTNNELLKEYLINDYKFEKKNIFFLIKFHYLITKKIGVYTSFNVTRIKKDLSGQLFVSNGFTYNLFKKK